MSWPFQTARYGNYESWVTHSYDGWRYTIDWSTETARTTVGVGSGRYKDVYEARYEAVRHLTNILPKAQSEKLLASQGELVWEEPWWRKHHSSR
jgi:hypothetical protein